MSPTHQKQNTRHFFDYIPSQKEPLLRWSVSTGLATGKSYAEATAKGLLEIIERDAFMLTYINKISPPRISLEYLAKQDEKLREILRSFKRYRLEVHLLELPTDFSVNIILAVIIDRSEIGPALCVGARAGFSLRDCVVDSLSEALKIRLGNRKRENDSNNHNLSAVQQRIEYWSKLENLPGIQFLLDSPSLKYLELDKNFYDCSGEDDIAREKRFATELEHLKAQLRKTGIEAYSQSITPKKIEDLGLKCVYVLSPQLQPLHLDERIPYLGGKRISSVPKKLGYSPAEKLNTLPHPFT